MTRIQYILKEIDQLDAAELKLILQEIHKRVEKQKNIKAILSTYKGIGKGIWNIDAQKYINKERDQDRA